MPTPTIFSAPSKDKILPPTWRFARLPDGQGGGNRAEKKQGVIAKLLGFFEKYLGLAR
jgi:type I restriction enzyme R subunit